eukprot:15291626-Alexandrium_andersonii.AAC.1
MKQVLRSEGGGSGRFAAAARGSPSWAGSMTGGPAHRSWGRNTPQCRCTLLSELHTFAPQDRKVCP